jgi:hypothetical protein
MKKNHFLQSNLWQEMAAKNDLCEGFQKYLNSFSL